jgi:hypothetical protein
MAIDHAGREAGTVEQYLGFDDECGTGLLAWRELRLFDRLRGERRRRMAQMSLVARRRANEEAGAKQERQQTHSHAAETPVCADRFRRCISPDHRVRYYQNVGQEAEAFAD